jgi:transposase InsO family protein
MARLTRFWHTALHIIQPDTLLRWHRDLFRLYWKRKSRSKKRKPRIPRETIDLIKQMARENPYWGAEKIRGELIKLGISIGKPTIQKYMKQVRRQSGQNWTNFLKNHAQDIWACDFTVVYDLLFRPIYIFIIIAHQNREIKHAAVTRHPTDAWTAQQLREATPWGKHPKYLIRDNDKKYGKQFSAVARTSGTKEIKTPFEAPRANAICERFIGSMRRECLNHFLILHQHQLSRLVSRYVDFYDQQRPHQGIDQQIPVRFGDVRPPLSNTLKGRVISTPLLHGLHHSYAYAH